MFWVMKYSFVIGNLKTKFPTNVRQRMLTFIKTHL